MEEQRPTVLDVAERVMKAFELFGVAARAATEAFFMEAEYPRRSVFKIIQRALESPQQTRRRRLLSHLPRRKHNGRPFSACELRRRREDLRE